METEKEAIGAWGLVRWSDTGEELQAYYSFGEYDEETDRDTYGIHDSKIFFYCSGGESELKSFMIGDDEHCTLAWYEVQYR